VSKSEIQQDAWSYFNPVKIVFEPLNNLPKFIKGQHVLLVTTPGFVSRGLVNKVRGILAPRTITLWDGVKPNPDMFDIDIATEKLRILNFDCVVGLGGGSALDAAKILATRLVSLSEPTLTETFRGGMEIKCRARLPLVVIPTTAGTGSEVSPFATVWDHSEHKKYSLSGDYIYPDIALLDAKLMLTLNEENTLYPALDTISHALESIWNKNSTPISRIFAFKALSLSVSYLPEVLKNENDIFSRKNLMMASTLAGIAISQTRTALAHSISYPLTSRYRVPHGLACSFTLPHILRANLTALDETPDEAKILREVLVFLDKLALEKRLVKYVTLEEAKKCKLEMNTVDRAGNYNGFDLGDIDTILEIGFNLK
jgi:phosphonate metabolism-associated iron-containing alcohol dehydrogenase